jgi:hypothetical protein
VTPSEERRGLTAGAVVTDDGHRPVLEAGHRGNDPDIECAVGRQRETGVVAVGEVRAFRRRHTAAVGDVGLQTTDDRIERDRRPRLRRGLFAVGTTGYDDVCSLPLDLAQRLLLGALNRRIGESLDLPEVVRRGCHAGVLGAHHHRALMATVAHAG